MPPRSITLVALNLDVDIVEDDGGFLLGTTSTTSDSSFDDSSNFKRTESQLFSPLNRKQHNKSKSVCYDEYDKVQEISHVKDFSKTKMDRLWFSRDERSETQAECRDLVRRFNASEVMTKDAMLGLERQTNAYLEPFLKRRRVVNGTVFRLQQKAHQRTSVLDRHTNSLIAKFCESSSVKPALQARLIALKLALEVKNEIGVSNDTTIYTKGRVKI